MEPPGLALGYSQFEEYTEAASPEEGFARLVAEAKSLYGDDPYNGTISTCNLGRVVHIADKYSTAAENKAAAWMKKYPGQKWVAACLDCGVTAYRKVTVKKATAPAKGTVYASRYVLSEKSHGRNVSEKIFERKEDAEHEEFRLAAKHPENLCRITRTKVLVAGTEATVTFEPHVENTGKKPKETKNSKVVPIHRYIYYGLAAE